MTSGGADHSRRTFVKGVTTAATASLALSASAGAAGAFDEHDDEYRTVIDVTDAGADPTGDESINSVLEGLRGDDTLLKFPEGRYYMDDQFRFTRYRNFGVVGEDGATIVPANHYDFGDSWEVLFRLGTIGNPGRDLLFENMRFDQRAKTTGLRAIEANVTDGLEVRDVRVYGYHDTGVIGPGHFNVVDPSGSGRVVDFRAEDGGEWTENTPNAGNTGARGPVGIIANNTEGELMFRRCHLVGFPGSGLYAVGGDGRIIVHGGYYKNNTSANIRIGGTNSVARWPTVVTDESDGHGGSQRGIRIERGNATIHGAAIDVSLPKTNCHGISVLNSADSAWIDETTVSVSSDVSNHGIVVSPGAGETTIARTQVEHTGAGGFPIWIRNSNSNEQVLCSEIEVTGEAGVEGGERDGIRVERDNTRIELSTIDQPGKGGAERNAVANFCDGLTVYDSELRGSRWGSVELGSNTLYLACDCESYDWGRSSVCLYNESRDVSIRGCRLAGGLSDRGSSNLYTAGNTTS